MPAKKKRKNRAAAHSAVKQTSATAALPVEAFGIAALILLVIFFLSTSWRKWPDPLIDFGRELYLPWRLSRGALLYRDVEGHYGPLSQYFNGALFKIFGPGLMVLVTANLVIFVSIVVLLYLLCRRAWGRGGAFAAVAIFVSIFGFSQFTGISNYNYATPYAHETTHGILVSLALTLVLVRWSLQGTVWLSLFAGFLYGLCAVLKPEFLLAGGLVAIAACALRWRYLAGPKLAEVMAMLVGAMLPTLGFTAYFALFFPFRDALGAATHAWLQFVTAVGEGGASGIQGGFSGLDKTGNHFTEHIVATGLAGVLIGSVAGLAWLAKRVRNRWLGISIGLVGCASLAWFSWTMIHWLEVGRCLLGLMLIYLAMLVVGILRNEFRSKDLHRAVPQLLLPVLGAALMARMALNGRIYHYGFYQAAIAGSVLAALLVGQIPAWLRANSRERALIHVLIAALLIPGLVTIVLDSQALLRTKTASVGEGRDQFYAFSRQMEPTGEIVAAVASELIKRKPDSLLVIPEGIMLNYLARIPSTLPSYFYSATGPQLMVELEARPPECVVVISRDLREYGVERYGDKPGSGQEILAWLSQNYGKIAQVGGNPLDVHQRGAVILKRTATP